MQFWEPITMSPGLSKRMDIGPLRIWVRRTEHEWCLASAGNEPPAERWDAAEAGDEPPEHASWSRWAAPSGEKRIHLFPVLPDRPIVVRPNESFRIPPGVHVRLYVQVPLWVRVVVGAATTLTEVSSVHLSNTWFGEPDAGELAWAVKTDPIYTAAAATPRLHKALCRIDLHHKGSEQLELKRLFIRVEHLRVYRAGQHLWTNGVKAVYEGKDKIGSVDYLKAAPSEAAGAVKLSDERTPISSPLVRTGAGLLRSLETERFRWGGA